MKKIGLVILGLGVLLIGIINFNKEEKKVLVEEEINNSNTSLVFMLQDKEGNYNKSEELPSSGYSFNTSKSVCSNNTTPTWEDNKLYLNNLNKNGTSCYLYFDIFSSAKNTILSNSKVNEGTPDFSQVATTDEGIYKAEDDWGESYYFRGAVTNNWVKFAGYYWRIIRINGDGSIRVIYNGTSTATTGDSTMINISQVFNSNSNRSEHVGYMYTTNQQHGNTINSDIKTVVDNWYNSNLKSQESKISKEVGFCGDREMASGYSWSSETSNTVYYKAYERLYTNKSPSLKCSNSVDLYTVSGSSKGNKGLSNPIGLISADEVVMAGGVYGQTNTSYYLHNNQYYWTMSPYLFSGIYAGAFYVRSNGDLHYNNVSSTSTGVRPVINLTSDVTLSGTGTASDPYIVEGAE